MRESRNKATEKNEAKIFKSVRRNMKSKDVRKRNIDKKPSVTDDDDGNNSVEVDTDPGDMQATARTCSSPVKSEYSEEGSGTDQSASSSVAGGNGSQSSGNRSNQFPSNSAKKQGISGIKFQPGTRLEAKDLGNGIWYAVKVVEVDWEEEEILIHFEKWSQRYDEWIPMDSSRLRPVMEPPGGSFVKKMMKIFKVGDKVMATWSDSRKYPATVKSVLGNDRYEVLFFDGFSKNIKGARMIPLKDEELAKIQELQPGIGPSNDVSHPPSSTSHPSSQMISSPMASALGTKEERRERKRKLNVAELFHFKKRPRVDSSSTQTSLENSKKVRRSGNFGNRGRKKGQWPEELHVSSVNSPCPAQVKIEQQSSEISEDKTVACGERNTVMNMENKRRESFGKGRSKCKSVDDFDKTMKRSKSDMSTQRSSEEGKTLSGKKIGRKLNRFREVGRRTHSTTPSRKEKGVEDHESQRSRKREGDGDSCKPARVDDWEPVGEPAYIVDGTDGPRKSIIVADPRIPPGWTRHTIQRMSGHSAGKWDVFFVCPQGRKFRTRHELRLYYEERGENFPSEQFDFSLGRRKNKMAVEREGNSTLSVSGASGSSSNLPKLGRQTGPGSSHLHMAISETSNDAPVRRVKTLLPRVRPGIDGGTPAVPHISSDLEDALAISDGSIVLGGLKIQKENDAFRCPKEGCNKNFRKENLLQMHMKHYHPEYNRFVASTPNVADLAYARTVGEPLEDLHSRTPRPSVLDKISRFEAMRRIRGIQESAATSQSASASPLTSTAVTSESPIPTSPLLNITPKALPGGPRRRVGDADVGNGSPMAENSDTIAPPCSPKVDPGEAPQCVVRTLMPVMRSTPTDPTQQLDLNDADGDSVVSSVCHSSQNLQPVAEITPVTDERLEEKDCDASSLVASGVSHTKSLRMVRRRHMSDFHMEPLLKKRKSDAEDPTQSAILSGNGSRQTRTESLRREELINCTCGYPEEDGLMIQCDLCMCWQHGLCNNIEHEDHVPEKYVCYICQNPPRERRSKHFLHDQDWLKEGRLPSLSFRRKNPQRMAQRESTLKRTHDLTGTLLQLQSVIHSLRVKVNIAEKKDHPKLYLWAQSWEKSSNNSQCQSSGDVRISDEQKVNKEIVENIETCKKTEQLQTCLLQQDQGDPISTAYESTLCEKDCEAKEAFTSLKEANDIHMPNDSIDLADECDTKDTSFSQDTIDSAKECGAQKEERKPLVESKIKSTDETEGVVLDNSIDIGTETEVSTAEVESGKEGEISEEQKELMEIAKESCNSIEEECNQDSTNEEKCNSSAIPCSDEHSEDSKVNMNEMDQPNLPDVPSSMGNPMNLSNIYADSNREPSVKAIQSAPQPEAPIDPTECRLTLLDHIEHLQLQAELRLASIEKEVEELESLDALPSDERDSDSRTKETIQMLLRDLSAVHDIASFN